MLPSRVRNHSMHDIASPDAPVVMSATNGVQQSPNRHNRILACVLCQHRKIKCDRSFPCSNCLKVGYSPCLISRSFQYGFLKSSQIISDHLRSYLVRLLPVSCYDHLRPCLHPYLRPTTITITFSHICTHLYPYLETDLKSIRKVKCHMHTKRSRSGAQTPSTKPRSTGTPCTM